MLVLVGAPRATVSTGSSVAGGAGVRSSAAGGAGVCSSAAALPSDSEKKNLALMVPDTTFLRLD